mmetsp:Transcript_24763/g.85438  ORF Transcript_24763/g.85438 Transcript_24763/m.85438 type:complete len:233 (-) Transcript_24763:151-849(-)
MVHPPRVPDEPVPVRFVRQPIREDAQRLVRPEADENGSVGRLRGLDHQDALHDASEVPQVEHVVRLGRRRQQARGNILVDPNRRPNNRRSQRLDARAVAGVQRPVQDRREDARQRVCAKGHEVEQVEVADVALRDLRAAAAGRPHGGDELDVDELAERILVAVVPSSVVHPLSEDLNGRLSPVLLLRRHVQIVHEDDARLAQRRPEDALAPLLELGVDDVLGLVRRRLRGKV